MRRKIIVLLISFLFFLPGLSSAQTTGGLQGQIHDLLQHVQQLQQQLSRTQNNQSTPWCHTFNINLRFGDSSSEVQALQTALKKDGESAIITGTFGSQTFAAVKRFQEKYSLQLLAPYGLTTGTGYAGKGTRNLLNAIYGCPPVITPIIPPTTSNTSGTNPTPSYGGGGGIVSVTPPTEPQIPIIVVPPPPLPAPHPIPTPTPTPTPPPVQPLVTIDTPANGATVNSPVTIHATYNQTASYMKVWVDHVADDTDIPHNTNTFAVSLSLSAGTHLLEVQAADAATGVVYTTPITINVAPPTPPPPVPPAPGITITNIQNRTDWKTCGACGNTGGGGALASYQMKPGISSPSLSGSSAQFSIDGAGQAYANAYWYAQQTAQAPTGPVKYISYSFDLYVPSVPSGVIQAIEFELQQGVNGKTYNFAWQADYAENAWRTFDYASKQWNSAPVPFAQFAPNSWHHILTTYHIDSTTGAGIHDSIAIDGQTHDNLNISYAPSPGSSNYLNNAFQLDTNSHGSPYGVYVDNMQIQFQD